MQHLLNLLAAIALLVWATHIVRTGVLRLFGSSLRELIARSIGNRFRALLAGLAVILIAMPVFARVAGEEMSDVMRTIDQWSRSLASAGGGAHG